MHKVSSADQEQLIQLWQSAKNRLQYLTQNDLVLIADKAKQLTFKKGERLVEQGKQAKVLYLLGAGKVNVVVSGVQIAQIGPGETCGEMGFLEESVASATATAEQEVKAYAIEWPVLHDLFELFPHLASRFYRSLALNLSRRLREQIVSKQSGKTTP
jgi:extracellular factor (EF) 3-hydroxypalmitic acid methyl ester biosynthesis protein